ncbi:hypothetical protein [Mycolicibacterium sp.]|uniref:hypothetical protein n=1 Tax=Mycolicibacterium sp. TaxID=2320850 RepID=UPI00355FC9A4
MPYPVDSDIRPCCQGLGRHGRYCPVAPRDIDGTAAEVKVVVPGNWIEVDGKRYTGAEALRLALAIEDAIKAMASRGLPQTGARSDAVVFSHA